MASPATGLKALNPKHYILAALTATLAAAVVITVVFVLLSPAHIYFSVTSASSYRQEDDAGVDLDLTLAANTTSHRAEVKYQSLYVDLMNYTASAQWTGAKMNTTGMSQWHPHGSVATVNATVLLLKGPWTKALTAGSMTGTPFVVKVTAVARFKVAGVPTRLYYITVSCGPITFMPPYARGHRNASSADLPAVCTPV